MINFCPIYGKWLEYFNDGNIDYSGYSPDAAIREKTAGQTVIDRWYTIPVPPPPRLKRVEIDPKTSALLVLDMETTICKSPRCIASITAINNLLTKARKKDMPVVYSLTHAGDPKDIAAQLSPSPGEPIVSSNVDKFYKTNLEEILRQKGIKTVIVTGYAANGAVLHTATSAAFRGYNVIVPVDCMSADNPYAEQYTAWHMLNSPGARNHATLTRVSLISFLP